MANETDTHDDVPPAAQFDVDSCDQPKGLGFYPSFHALWHLHVLGVADDLKEFVSSAWEVAEKGDPVRVAVIDTPVASSHPNLQGAINLALMRDFSVHDDGVFVFDADPKHAKSDAERKRCKRVLDERRKFLESIEADNSTIAKRIRQEVEDPDGKEARPPCSPKIFGAHGTAMAGLIGARPAKVWVQQPAYFDEEESESKPEKITLPYIGINPFCDIVPISTSAAPDTVMLQSALTYARMIGAQVVVIADSWSDEDPRKIGDDAFDNPEGGWAQVEAALLTLADKAIVLCAAGNSGKSALAYPASLAKSPDKKNLIAVTACRSDGKGLSYAPDPGLFGQLIATLSSEFPRYDRETEMLDPWAHTEPELGIPAGDPEYPPRRIISLDPPGPFGYNPSPYHYTPPPEGPHLEVGSLFAEFSGTSAATAIAAGLISLAIQAKIAPVEKKEGDSASNLFDLNAAAAARIDHGST